MVKYQTPESKFWGSESSFVWTQNNLNSDLSLFAFSPETLLKALIFDYLEINGNWCGSMIRVCQKVMINAFYFMKWQSYIDFSILLQLLKQD